MVRFGILILGRVHFCVKGHFAGPKHFKTSKVCSVLASSKVTGTERNRQTSFLDHTDLHIPLFWGPRIAR